MSDYIKREDAIGIAKAYGIFQNISVKGATEHIVSDLTALKSADVVERRRGEWMDTHLVCYGVAVFQCSECKTDINEMPTYYGEPVYKFCPYCGADMRADRKE